MTTTTKPITLAQQKYIKAIVDYLNINQPELETVTDGKNWLTQIFKKYPTLQEDMKAQKEEVRLQKEQERNFFLYEQFKDGYDIEVLASKHALPVTVVKTIIQNQSKTLDKMEKI